MTLRIRFWSTFFSVIGLALLITLGTWQLIRYQEAKDFEDRRDAQIGEAPVDLLDLEALEAGDLDFRQIRARGTWDLDRTFLIKHRVLRGNPGAWVVNALILDGHAEQDPPALMVNRGWIPFADAADRALLLQQELPEGPQTITGLVHPLDYVVVDDGAQQRLDELESVTGVFELDSYDTTAMRRAFDGPTIERDLVLTISATDGADTYPTPTVGHVTDRYLTSETHFGYMLTWYLLALALIAIWLAGSLGMLGSRSYDDDPRPTS